MHKPILLIQFIAILALMGLGLVLAPVVSMAGAFTSAKGYNIQPPPGWIQGTPGEGVDAIFIGRPDKTGASPSIQVSVISLASTAGLSKELTSGIDALLSGEKSFPNFQLLGRGITTVDGHKAGFLAASYRGAVGASLLRVRQVILANGNVGYVVTCVASDQSFAQIRPLFEKALNSFGLAAPPAHAVDSHQGYTFTPPKGWTVTTGDDGVLKVVEQGATYFAANVGVKVAPLSDPSVTADDMYQQRDQLNAGMLQQLPQSVILSQQIATIGGVHAFDTTATFQSSVYGNNVTIRMRQLIVPHAGKQYTFTWLGLDEKHNSQDAVFQGILNSVQWSS